MDGSRKSLDFIPTRYEATRSHLLLTDRMQLLKNTQRARVTRSSNGSISKCFSGPNKEERFANEVKVLQHLNQSGCDFVPKLLSYNEETLCIVTTTVGEHVQHISERKLESVFQELEAYGVIHGDRASRNVLYHHGLGRFSVIDFEFAELVEPESALRKEAQILQELDDLQNCLETEL